MQSTAIEHSGIVKKILGNHIEVDIQTSSACAHCSATDQCVSADSKTRTISIDDYDGPALREGDVVQLTGSSKTGLKAVMIAYFIPFILVVATLFIANYILKNEASAGLMALGILIPYYAIVWLSKSKIKKQFSFKIQIS